MFTGGFNGFQNRVFDVIKHEKHNLMLRYLSLDGEEGFPGNLLCDISFSLTNNNELSIKYKAQTDKPTIVNLTNHSYFNLEGNPNKSIINHLLKINGDYFTPIDSTFITTGDVCHVANTEMDFRILTPIKSRINNKSAQLINGKGYDHNWVINKTSFNTPCATLTSKETGIILNIYTTEPGIQIYTGNFLDGTLYGKKNINYKARCGICLDTQKFPDSPNKPNWPSAIMRM